MLNCFVLFKKIPGGVIEIYSKRGHCCNSCKAVTVYGSPSDVSLFSKALWEGKWRFRPLMDDRTIWQKFSFKAQQ